MLGALSTKIYARSNHPLVEDYIIHVASSTPVETSQLSQTELNFSLRTYDPSTGPGRVEDCHMRRPLPTVTL